MKKYIIKSMNISLLIIPVVIIIGMFLKLRAIDPNDVRKQHKALLSHIKTDKISNQPTYLDIQEIKINENANYFLTGKQVNIASVIQKKESITLIYKELGAIKDKKDITAFPSKVKTGIYYTKDAKTELSKGNPVHVEIKYLKIFQQNINTILTLLSIGVMVSECEQNTRVVTFFMLLIKKVTTFRYTDTLLALLGLTAAIF